MQISSAIGLAVGLMANCLVAAFAETSAPLSSVSNLEQRVEALLSKMTLDEKVGQTVLFTSSGDVTGDSAMRRDLERQIRNGMCGNIFNAIGVQQIRPLQRIAVEETRLKIPVLFGYDIIHGFKTIFPIPLAEAASWNLQRIETSARIAAVEGAAAGLNWTFAPMVDIARDPRWGRIAEGAGEDPFLGCQIAKARVRGFQGKDLAAPNTLLACVKHYAAYGAAEGGRDYNTVDMSERTLREVYLPPYHAAIEAGALSVMVSFNDLNGVPATANPFLIRDVLRKEWGFEGFVVSDYTGIAELLKHGTVANAEDAAFAAFSAGVDMDMQGAVYLEHLKNLVKRGAISGETLDQSVRRILRVKAMLGLLDDPFRYCNDEREKKLIYAPEHLKAAYAMSCESMVLLKNDKQALPLKTGRKLAVIGPLAKSTRDLLGTWAGRGDADRATSVFDAIRAANVKGDTLYAKGCDVISEEQTGIEEALRVAREAQAVVLVLGESADMSGEAASRTSINLPGAQTELLRRIKKLGKPMVLVLLNGRPLALQEETEMADAILEAWHGGTMAGPAVADLLFGTQNPSGRLPVSFPRNVGQVPIYYSAKSTGRPWESLKAEDKYKSRYLDSPNDPLYQFGFGLSYTHFAYSDLHLDKTVLKPGDLAKVSITVKNDGHRDGAEVVQLYLRDLVGSVTRPLLELKGFQKILLAPGESKRVSFTLGENELAFLRADNTWGTEPGEFRIFVGSNCRDLASTTIKLVSP